MENYIAFDIGGSSIKWSIINLDGDFLENGKISIQKTVDNFFESIADKVNELKGKYKLNGVAISAPGAVDSISGTIGGSSALPYIHGPNFKVILKKMTNLPIEIENDANCAALGECWKGVAINANDSAFVVCGTGIGGAVIKDKKVHTGVHKHGGEFGYCFVDIDVTNKKYLSWSRVGSTFALAKAIANRKGISVNEFNGIKAFELYDNGDEIAIEEVNKFFSYMAIGIYNIQYTYDPEVVILGGAICEREGLLEEINKKIDEIMDNNDDAKIRPVVKMCEYGNNANKLGALYNFLQKQDLI
ncbi:Beta-glucoside kinase [uncultured Clostridium sp.]|uniref:ROK family protein n=1 Tax=uncultured Clostridium sp. TaxID=59620 RepID=UPI0008217FCB|nr:ROK family protein [uncultured Clostridium sp.]SCJ02199.1 Beta-glucoside kinase [uncultured Clostridium sp.]